MPREHHALDCLDGEASAFDSRGRIAGRVAAAGQPGPQPAVVQRLEKQPFGLAIRDHVLVETKLAARPHDAMKLGERAVLIGNRAENQARNGGIDAGVLEWQLVGGAGQYANWHRRGAGGRDRSGSERRLRLDGNDLRDLARIVREVEAVPGAELEDCPGQAVEEPAPVFGGPAPLGVLGRALVQAGEAGTG